MVKLTENPMRESWHSFFVIGLLFPAHLVLGVLSVPYWIYCLLMGSYYAWWFTVLYLPFFLYPAQANYPGWKGCDAFWNWMNYEKSGKDYFGSLEVHGGDNIKNKKGQYCIACHPHGTVIFQRIFWRGALDKVFQNDWRMIGVSALFYIPIVRELTLWFGAVNASKSTCEKILKAGGSLVVYPGGLDEANSAEGGQNIVRVKTRTGFIRLALKYNSPVVPVFTFGELDCVDAVNPFPQAVSQWIKRTFRMSTTFFMGRFYSIIPYKVPFHMVIGTPIAQKHCPEAGPATDAEVQRIHAEYKAQLRDLFEKNKEAFGYADRKLVFQCEEEEARRAKKNK